MGSAGSFVLYINIVLNLKFFLMIMFHLVSSCKSVSLNGNVDSLSETKIY